MGTHTGPEDASAGASTPPRGKRPAATAAGRRLAAGLVVVMLVLASTAILLDRLSPPVVEDPDDDGPDIQPEPGSIVYITQDTRWSSLTGSYNSYCEVWAGRTLTLVDCDLTVAYEDLVLADRPLFTVNDDGALRLESTRLRVTLDPNVTRAVYHSAVNLNRWETEIPILSRVVNLLHASSPVLSLNVSWRASRTDLVVVGQRSFYDPMVPLARLGAGGEGWEHIDVDLSTLAGAVARVAVFPLDNEYDLLFISDAMVLDGGTVPPGERFGTGSLEADGWDLSNFRTLMDVGEDYHTPTLGPLIESQGTLVLDNCTIEEPAGLPRWTESDEYYPSSPSDLIGGRMYLTSTIGLQIQADRGTVQMDSTELVNVPLRAQWTDVNIRGSRLAGDADTLTCRRCTGTVNGCDVLRYPSPTLRGYDTDRKRWTWAMSLEEDDPSRHFTLDAVHVQGGDLGLYIGGTGPLIDDCSFSDSTTICLWSDGPSQATTHGGWPQLNASCRFGPSEGHRYLETRLCEVELVWSEAGLGPSPMGTVSVSMEDWEELPVSQDGSYMEDDSISTIRLPAASVNSTGEVRTFANVTLIVDPYEGPQFEHAIVPGTAHEVVEVDPWYGTPEEVREMLTFYDLALLLVIPSEEAGEAVLDIVALPDVLRDYLDLNDVIVRTRLAGAVVLEDYLYEGVIVDDYRTPPYPWGFHFYTRVHLEPGLNVLEIEVIGLWEAGLSRELVWNRTYALLRANGSTDVDEARTVLRDGGTLLLDPGEDLDLGGPLPSEEYDDLNYVPFNCALWNGSELTVGAAQGKGSWTYIYGLYEGPGNLTLRDMVTTYIDLSAVNGTLRIEGLQYGGFGVQLYDTGLEVRRSEIIWGAYAVALTCSTVLIEDSVVRADGQRSTIMEVAGFEALLVNITNTTFIGSGPTTVSFSASNGADILLDGCTFTNVTVHIQPDRASVSGNITAVASNCTFAGDCAYLVVLDTRRVTSMLDNVVVWLWDCTFVGAGTGVVTQKWTYSSWDNITLEDGALVMVFQLMRIDLSESRTRYHVDVVGEPFLPAFMSISPFKDENGILLEDIYLPSFDIQAGEPPSGWLDAVAMLVIYTSNGVVWFEEVELDGNNVFVEIPEWDHIDTAVAGLRSDILAGIDWWT